jgi:hypothetical protein
MELFRADKGIFKEVMSPKIVIQNALVGFLE